MNPRQMNPRQRQGLLLVLIAALGLIGVFLLIANYVSGVSKQVGPKVNVLALRRPLQPYQTVSGLDLQYVQVPARWVPGTALRYPSQAEGMVSEGAFPAGEELQQGMVGPAPSLSAGKLEIGISVDQVTGVAGQLQAGSKVDIVATFSSGSGGQPASARVVVPDVTVLVPAQSTSSGGAGVVTLAVTPKQMQQVAYVQSFAEKYWLALIAPSTPPGQSPQLSPYQPGL